MTVSYRTIRDKEDSDAIYGIVCDTWHFDRLTPTEESAALLKKLMMNSYFSSSNYGQTAVDAKGEVLGFLFGRSNPYGPAGSAQVFVTAEEARLQLMFLQEAADAVSALLRGQYAGRTLLTEAGKDFDSEIVLFAVKSAAQGQGIGKTLLNNFLSWTQETGARSLYVLTNDLCAYPFYDRRGFSLAGEKSVLPKSEYEAKTYYLYTMNLPDEGKPEPRGQKDAG